MQARSFHNVAARDITRRSRLRPAPHRSRAPGRSAATRPSPRQDLLDWRRSCSHREGALSGALAPRACSFARLSPLDESPSSTPSQLPNGCLASSPPPPPQAELGAAKGDAEARAARRHLRRPEPPAALVAWRDDEGRSARGAHAVRSPLPSAVYISSHTSTSPAASRRLPAAATWAARVAERANAGDEPRELAARRSNVQACATSPSPAAAASAGAPPAAAASCATRAESTSRACRRGRRASRAAGQILRRGDHLREPPGWPLPLHRARLIHPLLRVARSEPIRRAPRRRRRIARVGSLSGPLLTFAAKEMRDWRGAERGGGESSTGIALAQQLDALPRLRGIAPSNPPPGRPGVRKPATRPSTRRRDRRTLWCSPRPKCAEQSRSRRPPPSTGMHRRRPPPRRACKRATSSRSRSAPTSSSARPGAQGVPQPPAVPLARIGTRAPA